MVQKNITKQYSSDELMSKSFAGVIIIVFGVLTVMGSSYRSRYINFLLVLISLMLIGVLITLVIRHLSVSRQLAKRIPILVDIRRRLMASESQAVLSKHNSVLTAITLKNNVRNAKFSNVMTTKEWSYADYSYDIYRKKKYGEYRAYTVYYSFLMIELPRKLPNVFFDSMSARKQQFKLQFAKVQKHSLEGNFDSFFNTYFPYDYSIDSLSFITPEVMQSLIEAKDYDIEIKDNFLYLFGAIGDPQRQIADITQKAAVIKEKLLHNINTYRDDRLPYADGRKEVSIVGKELWKNLTLPYLYSSLGIGAIISGIVIAVVLKTFPGGVILVGLTPLLIYGSQISQELTRRKRDMRLTESFDIVKTGILR